MSDVYVLGVDMIKFGISDRSVPNIGAEAALMALDDAVLLSKICKLCIAEILVKQMQWLDKEFFKNWPNGYTSSQLCKCLCNWCYSI